ncbi:hypothetical protein BST83_15470 [Polaribacter filamentus]|uniref:Uncharacterized protein n=1 Tax=Polaribacter filamentus TaxID=53483 RepID=A0A2S7L0G1_9FLAO|nr:hypothetical protein [Polaribacter filamentus]PQB08370.1 hypothetical protein BST83_15470 [Polaribacter filamentus]
MKIFHIKRKIKYQKYYSSAMGMLNSRVTYIKKYFLGIPFKTIHTQRVTYYGEVKKSDDCNLFI